MDKLNRKFYDRLFFLGTIILVTLAYACVTSHHAKNISAINKNVNIQIPDTPIEQGGLFVASVCADSSVTSIEGEFQNHKVPFFVEKADSCSTNRFVGIVGIEYGTKPGTVELKLRANTTHGMSEMAVNVQVVAGVFPSEELLVPPRTVEPSKKDMIQIEKDTKVLKKVYSTLTTQRFWDPPATMPVDNIVTSKFGAFRVYNGKKINAHLGTDLRAPIGTPIRAPFSGKVALARWLFFTGYTVILDHGYGLFTIYGHMSKLKTKEGRIAKKGQLLGLSGKTGRASGPHLHWGVNLHGTKVDPIAMLHELEKVQWNAD